MQHILFILIHLNSDNSVLTIYKCYCSFILPANFIALLLWMLSSLFFCNSQASLFFKLGRITTMKHYDNKQYNVVNEASL